MRDNSPASDFCKGFFSLLLLFGGSAVITFGTGYACAADKNWVKGVSVAGIAVGVMMIAGCIYLLCKVDNNTNDSENTFDDQELSRSSTGQGLAL